MKRGSHSRNYLARASALLSGALVVLGGQPMSAESAPPTIQRSVAALKQSAWFESMQQADVEQRSLEARRRLDDPEQIATGVNVQDGWLHRMQQVEGGHAYRWFRISLADLASRGGQWQTVLTLDATLAAPRVVCQMQRCLVG